MTNQIKLLARDNARPGNRELVDFLNRYLESLVTRGVKFDFRIVEESEIPMLVQKGIVKLPAAVVGTKIYTSSVEIKSMLMGLLNRNARSTGRVKRDPVEEMRDMYAAEMSMEAAERDNEIDDDTDRTKRDLMDKYNEERQRREEEINKKNKNERQPKRRQNVDRERDQAVKTAVKTQAQPGGDKDDVMLMRMFEETDS